MKLVSMMKFLKQTVEDQLTLQSDGTRTLKWHVNAAFAVHPDFKSHTSGILMMEKAQLLPQVGSKDLLQEAQLKPRLLQLMTWQWYGLETS